MSKPLAFVFSGDRVARKKQRLLSSLATVVMACATATASLPVPAAHAESEIKTTNKAITASCKTSNLPVVGAQTINLDDPVGITIKSPEHVTVGEEFDVKVSIAPINLSLGSLPGSVSLQRASRLKMDLARPRNLELVSYQMTGGNLPVNDAQLITVDENGRQDPQGSIIRLTDKGHHTVGNGGNAGSGNHAGLGVNLSGKKSINLKFPDITLRLRATEPGSAQVGMRLGGYASSPGEAKNAITILASASVPILGTQWVTAGCVPKGKDAKNLLKIHVDDLPAAATNTQVVAPTEAIKVGVPAVFQAIVPKQIPGSVQFFVDGRRKTVPVDAATGRASTDLVLDSINPTEVTATFLPQDPKSFASSSAKVMVTATQQVGEMTLAAAQPAKANKRVPVSVVFPDGAKGELTLTASDGQEKTIQIFGGGKVRSNFVFTNPATVDVTAHFDAAPDSTVTAPDVTKSIVVEQSDETSLALSGLGGSKQVAEPVEVVATVNPKPGTTGVDGTVEFDFAGERLSAAVENGEARVTYAFPSEGEVTVTATYQPAAGSGQTEAEDSFDVQVIDRLRASLALTGPDEVTQGQESDFELTVSPASAGTARVLLNGEEISRGIPVDASGTATIAVAAPRSGVRSHRLSVEFTPEGLAQVAAVAEKDFTAQPVAVQAEPESSLEMNGPIVIANSPKLLRFKAEPKVEGMRQEDISGYITLNSNGQQVVDDAGKEVRIPVVQGIADMSLVWLSAEPAEKNLVITFFAEDGTQLSKLTKVFTATGAAAARSADIVRLAKYFDPAGQQSVEGEDHPDASEGTDAKPGQESGTGSPQDNSFWGMLVRFFELIKKFFVDLFSGNGAATSSSSAKGGEK